MKKKRINIDRGAVLAIAVQRLKLDRKEAANRAGYTRSAYYKHIAQPDLKTEILVKYSDGLNYDFSIDIPEMAAYSMLDSGNEEPTTLAEAIRQRDTARRKLTESLERENELQRKYVDLLEWNLAGWLRKVKITKRSNR